MLEIAAARARRVDAAMMPMGMVIRLPPRPTLDVIRATGGRFLTLTGVAYALVRTDLTRGAWQAGAGAATYR